MSSKRDQTKNNVKENVINAVLLPKVSRKFNSINYPTLVKD